MTDRKKPGVAFWATVVVVAYVFGFGSRSRIRTSPRDTVNKVNEFD